MDIVSKTKRSEMMSRIRGKNTLPELTVRKYLYSRGYRYRIHDTRLPGKPDIVLSRKRIAIEVRGCFWHGHNCKFSSLPKSNRSFWIQKISKNRLRDKKNKKKLAKIGYNLIVIHECKVRKGSYKKTILRRIKEYE
jgi:DNA mismatch endonuclease (patch repair protein)